MTAPKENQTEITEPVCFVCGKSGKYVCGACWTPLYCSLECQKQDWYTHRRTCTGTGEETAKPPEAVASEFYVRDLNVTTPHRNTPRLTVMKRLCENRSADWNPLDRGKLYDENLDRTKYEEMHIGRGTYGDVFAMISKAKHGEIYAVKVSHENTQAITPGIVGDLMIRNMAHPNITSVCKVGWFTERSDNRFAVFMDRANMDLLKYVRMMKGAFDAGDKSDRMFDDRKIAAFQVANAVAYLASIATLHCDIKTENFLVGGIEGGEGHVPRVMLTDFGISLPFATMEPTSSMLYTLWWRAPEILLGSEKAKMASEVWACGCVIYELLSFKYPFGTPKAEYEQMVNIARALRLPTMHDMPGLATYNLWNLWKDDLYRDVTTTGNSFKLDLAAYPGAYELLTRMLNINPQARPTIYEVLDDPFFSTMRFRDTTLVPNVARDYVYRTIADSKVEHVPMFDAGKRITANSAVAIYRRMQRFGPVFPNIPPVYEFNLKLVRLIYVGWRKTVIGGFANVFVAIDLARTWISKTKRDISAMKHENVWAAALLDISTMYTTKRELSDNLLRHMFGVDRSDIEDPETRIVVDIDFDIHRSNVCTMLGSLEDKNAALYPNHASYHAAHHFALMVMEDSILSSGMQCYEIACQAVRMEFGPDVPVKNENDGVIATSDVFVECVKKHFKTYVGWIIRTSGISTNGLNALLASAKRWPFG